MVCKTNHQMKERACIHTMPYQKKPNKKIFKIIDVFVKVVNHVCICLVLVQVVVCVKLSRDFICQILKKSFGAPLQDGPPNAAQWIAFNLQVP